MAQSKICYLEIPAITVEESAGFYSSIFGWTVRERGDGELAFDDTCGVSGTWVKESDRTPDEQTRICIVVDDISETLKKIEAVGGRGPTPRTDIAPGSGAFAIFADPAGSGCRAVGIVCPRMRSAGVGHRPRHFLLGGGSFLDPEHSRTGRGCQRHCRACGHKLLPV